MIHRHHHFFISNYYIFSSGTSSCNDDIAYPLPYVKNGGFLPPKKLLVEAFCKKNHKTHKENPPNFFFNRPISEHEEKSTKISIHQPLNIAGREREMSKYLVNSSLKSNVILIVFVLIMRAKL